MVNSKIQNYIRTNDLSVNIIVNSGVPLDELLSDAPQDGIDLVKSLLVLDPLRRLTAKEALSHRYVEKFRNTASEIELKMDVLPPFRDDVRLTVPEYRSKLYEIAQGTMDKRNKLEHKLQYNLEKAERNKELFKNKHLASLDEKYINKDKYLNSREQSEKETQNQNNIIANKPLKKTGSPVHKREFNKTKKSAPNDLKQIHQCSDGAKTNNHVYKSKTNLAVKESLESSSKNYVLKKCNSIECVDIGSMNSNLKTHNITHNIHQPVSEEYKGYPPQDMLERLNQISLYDIRNIKSDVIPNITTSSLGKKQEHMCYERRLKKLEEEIEKYKMEVKSFCTETYRYIHPAPATPADKNQQQFMNSGLTRKASTLPTMTTANNNMKPKKNSYLHLFSRGNRDFVLSDFDFTSMGACNSTGGSGDHIARFYNSNNSSKSNAPDYKAIVEAKLSQNFVRVQNQHRKRSTTKFLSRPQAEGCVLTKSLQ